jgi:predicted nucleic-acid-binding Zn-ribbon protein
MRRGTCPKCNGSEVYAARNGVNADHRVGIRPHVEPGFRGMLVPHQTQELWNYLCGACGYVEAYLIDDAALGFVRQKWLRVPTAPPPDAAPAG